MTVVGTRHAGYRVPGAGGTLGHLVAVAHFALSFNLAIIFPLHLKPGQPLILESTS